MNHSFSPSKDDGYVNVSLHDHSTGSPRMKSVATPSFSTTLPIPVPEHKPLLSLPSDNPFAAENLLMPPPSVPSRSSSPLSRSLSSSPPIRAPSPMRPGPFNFQPTTFSPSKAAQTNQRRGHRYKHSSVSINFFKEPEERAPLPIPASLPIPNLRECLQSMSKEQTIRSCWCIVHFAVALLIYFIDSPFATLNALSHLLFYDAMSATLCAAVDVLSNFDVWKQSSIHHPFGLERIELLAGFALAISLVFMGGDIMSHCIQEIVQSIYHDSNESAAGHHHHGYAIHEDSHISFPSIILKVLLSIGATFVSAVGLGNHNRIAKIMYNDSEFTSLPSILSNPSHFMTVTFSLAILLFPVLNPSEYYFVDTIITPLMAGSMCYVGWTFAKCFGGMLVMSFVGADNTSQISANIKASSNNISSVENISLWQVHYDLWLCSLKIVMTGTDDEEQRTRQYAATVVGDYIKQSPEANGARCETTVDIVRTTLD